MVSVFISARGRRITVDNLAISDSPLANISLTSRGYPMKRFSRVLTSSILSVLLLGGVASAVDGSSITNTGPGSNNSITTNSNCSTTVTNSTTIDGSNTNQQNSQTGGTTGTNTTSSGNTSTGSASNTNTSVTDVTVNNSTNPGCNPQATTTPTPSGGQVEGASTTAVGGQGGATLSDAQVQAPVGGVGAGNGGLSSSIFIGSILSGAVGLYRLRKQKSLNI